MKPQRKITNESIIQNRLKMINSHGYRRKVKKSIELFRTYLLLDVSKGRSKMDENKGKMPTAKQIAQCAHFFAEELRVESGRRDREPSNLDNSNQLPVDSVKY